MTKNRTITIARLLQVEDLLNVHISLIASFHIGQFHIVAKLIQHLNECLVDDLLSATDDTIYIGERHTNHLSDFCLSNPFLIQPCLQVKFHIVP